jgi:hypothetical protein
MAKLDTLQESVDQVEQIHHHHHHNILAFYFILTNNFLSLLRNRSCQSFPPLK